MPVYAYYFVDTLWIKVGYADDVIQRATDGWWENSHPEDLHYKLDIRHALLLGNWTMTKEEEEKLHRHFRGAPGTLPLKRYASRTTHATHSTHSGRSERAPNKGGRELQSAGLPRALLPTAARGAAPPRGGDGSPTVRKGNNGEKQKITDVIGVLHGEILTYFSKTKPFFFCTTTHTLVPDLQVRPTYCTTPVTTRCIPVCVGSLLLPILRFLYTVFLILRWILL